jgi:hypothetical protein
MGDISGWWAETLLSRVRLFCGQFLNSAQRELTISPKKEARVSSSFPVRGKSDSTVRVIWLRVIFPGLPAAEIPFRGKENGWTNFFFAFCTPDDSPIPASGQ